MQSLSSYIPEASLNQDVYTDLSGLSRLRRQAQENPEETLKSVARQFEALFMQMMLKSMRDASFGDPFFDNSQSELYQDMFDKQITLNMSQGKGMGLAEMLTRQLRTQMGTRLPASSPAVPVAEMKPASGQAPKPEMPVFTAMSVSSSSAAKKTGKPEPESFASPGEFIRYMQPLAQRAAEKLGVDAEVLLAQAALETGWGKHINRHADGSSSHNLFNIKAGQGWEGDRLAISTLEYRNGIARQERAAFRAYDSYADSFDDYVAFLQSRPRYRAALEQAGDAEGFVRELHGAGYATDPAYADKILDIMQRPVVQAAMNGADYHAG